MKISGKIGQLAADYGEAFMNVLPEASEYIGVWGCSLNKTALFKSRYKWFIVQFSDPSNEAVKEFEINNRVTTNKAVFVGWLDTLGSLFK